MQPPHYPMGAPSEAWHHIRGGGGEPRPQSAPPQTWPARPPVRHREAPGASRPHKGGLPSVPSSESLERLRGAMAQVQAAQAHPEQHDMRAPPHGFREGPEQEMAPMGVPSHLEIMQMRQAAAAMAAAKYASRQAEGLLDRGQGGRPEGRAGPGDGGAGGSARVALDGMAISPAVVEERQRQWLLMQQHQQALLQHRLQQQQQGQVRASGGNVGQTGWLLSVGGAVVCQERSGLYVIEGQEGLCRKLCQSAWALFASSGFSPPNSWRLLRIGFVLQVQ